jgi:hypothetical protein
MDEEIVPDEIEELVDKLRWAASEQEKNRYLSQLLALFDPATGSYIGRL